MSSASRIEYSEKYADENNEYRYVANVMRVPRNVIPRLWSPTDRSLTLSFFSLFLFKIPAHRHVILPKELAKTLPKSRLLTESEWRSIGVQQSRGWQHYAIHR